MIYTINLNPDNKTIKYTGKFKDNKTLKINIPFKNNKNKYIHYFLTGNISKNYSDYNNSICIYNNIETLYLEIKENKEKKYNKCIEVEPNIFVGIPKTKKRFWLINMLFLLILSINIIILSDDVIALIKEKVESQEILNKDIKENINDSNNTTDSKDTPKIAECKPGDEINLEIPQNTKKEYNTYTGFTKAVISKNAREIPFINSKLNTTYANYTVYNDKEEIIFESGLMAPDGHIFWDAYETFNENGEYTIAIKCIFYELYSDENGEPIYIACPTIFYNKNIKIVVTD